MKPEPTYIYENDKTYIMVEGSIIGSVEDDALIEEEAERLVNESATHVVTPNGLKGRILGRVKGLWEDQVTVRFENGRIVQLPVNHVSFTTEASEENDDDPIAALSARVAAKIDGDLTSLKARVKELDKIKAEARHIIDSSKLSDVDLSRAGEIITLANYESNEIGEVVSERTAALADAFEPIAPYRMAAVEQGGPSRGDTWLDATLHEMHVEAAATDYEKLMEEGPEAFVASLDSPVLVDAGAVRNIASSFIRERTAATDEGVREKYERVWLERVEMTRRQALASYKEVTKKEAAMETEQLENLPDDALFL